MCTLNQAAAPSSTVQALAMVSAGLGFLAGCDAADLGAAAQAEALVGLEQAEAQHHGGAGEDPGRVQCSGRVSGGWAVRAQGVAAGVHQDHPGRGGRGPGVGAAAGRAPGHRRRAGGGAAQASWARQICDWTGQLPEDLRSDADQILLAAAAGGADLHDLKALAREMIERARTTPDPDEDGFADRAVWLQTTLDGAGRLQGDLTPECAASLAVILDALAEKGGPEDAPDRRAAPP